LSTVDVIVNSLSLLLNFREQGMESGVEAKPVPEPEDIRKDDISFLLTRLFAAEAPKDPKKFSLLQPNFIKQECSV
jgi:hypothetical protein